MWAVHTRCYVGLYICLYSIISLFPGCLPGSPVRTGSLPFFLGIQDSQECVGPELSFLRSDPASALSVRGWGAQGGRARGGKGEGTEEGGEEAVWDVARGPDDVLSWKGRLRKRGDQRTWKEWGAGAGCRRPKPQISATECPHSGPGAGCRRGRWERARAAAMWMCVTRTPTRE